MQASILKAYSTPLQNLFDSPSGVDFQDCESARLDHNQQMELFLERQNNELMAKQIMRANVDTLLKLRASKHNMNLVALEIAIFFICQC